MELSDFLRTRRTRLSPSDVGLATSGRRRTPGLRREEVAVIAGVGTSWYTWLEQGRDIKVSETVAHAVSKALRLNESERTYFYRLLEIGSVGDLSGSPGADANSDFDSVVNEWLPNPAFVLNEFWDLLACNDVAREVFGLTEADDNLLIAFFTSENCRSRYVESAMMAKLSVAQFRANMARHFDSPRFAELAAHLSERSPEFDLLWHSHEVLEMQSKLKKVRHPRAGLMTFQTHVWQLRGYESISLVLYLPAADVKGKLLDLLPMPEGPAA
jgi:transcriptional regulator with XRE-family HTH domain